VFGAAACPSRQSRGHSLALRVDKPILLVLNVHRERSRNRLAVLLGWFLEPLLSSRVSESASRASLAQLWLKKEAVSPSSVSTSEPAEPAPSSSTNTARSLRRARKSTPASPVRNPAGRSKTRATGGAPPHWRFAKPFRPPAWQPNPSPPSDSPARCTAPSSSMKTTKSSAQL
jgi:hypothetical protein